MLRKVLGATGGLLLFAATPCGATANANMQATTPTSNWSGFYLGINGGYGVATDPFKQTLTELGVSISSPINSRVTPLGGLFGGQFGYNYQTSHWVFGLGGDIQWDGQEDKAGCGLICISVPGVDTETLGSLEQKINWFSTVRGRLGWANNGWLAYITGGGAWGRIGETTNVSRTGILPDASVSSTTNYTKGGWVLGGGTEMQIADSLSASLEYLYMNLGSTSQNMLLGPSFGSDTLSTQSWIHDNIIRVSLNYKFDIGKFMGSTK